MRDTRLKTAVLGLVKGGLGLLEAAANLEQFHIQAVADNDSQLAEQTAAKYKCAAYDDYRQLITQNQLDCLLVAAGLYSCDEYVRMAMKKKFNVLKLAPAARNFEEAAELVRLADDEQIKFAVACPLYFTGGFSALREFLEAERIEHVYLVTGFCAVEAADHKQWHTDPKLSGGGVLLRNCYEMVHQIVSDFSIPQQVYSLSTNQAGDRQQRLYLTEDTMVVTMKFSDTCMGNLTAGKGLGPEKQLLTVCGKDMILTADKNNFTVSDSSGQLLEQQQFETDEVRWMTKILESLALSLLEPDKHPLFGSARDNLKTMALIESAYLSSRTAMPEEPGRIFEMTAVG